MNRAVFFSPTLLAVALSPALLYSDCSPKTGNPNLVSLEVEAGSINRLIGFNNATADYSVWLDGAATITIRGQAEDPGSTISWETGPTRVWDSGHRLRRDHHRRPGKWRHASGHLYRPWPCLQSVLDCHQPDVQRKRVR